MILKVRDNIFMKTLSRIDAPEVFSVIDGNRLYLRKWLPWGDATDSEAVVENVIGDWERRFRAAVL